MTKHSHPPDPELARLRARLRSFRALSAALFAACIGMAGWIVRDLATRDGAAPNPPYVQKDAPNSTVVEKVIGRLRYSGFESLMRPEVALDIDFQGRTWTLRGINAFEPDGTIRLIGSGRHLYGVCDQLVLYAYRKLKPHFPGDRYRIEFAETFESSYFEDETGGRHLILRIVDLAGGRDEQGNYRAVYLLDPALRRYGSPVHFDTYRAVRLIPAEEFAAARDPDSGFAANGGPPIVINRAAVTSLYVSEANGRFDPENFQISLYAVRRYRFSGNSLFVIRREGGRTVIEEAEYPVEKIMNKGRYRRLKEAVTRLYRDMEAKL